MGICYNEERVAGAGVAVSIAKMDGTKAFLRHFENFLYLAFISKSSNDGAERRQAEHEIAVAERKMAFWEKHPNYVREDALKGMEALKNTWKGR